MIDKPKGVISQGAGARNHAQQIQNVMPGAAKHMLLHGLCSQVPCRQEGVATVLY